nr:MAG TPA: hypothetical protein [Caudoviricetes sp.]
MMGLARLCLIYCFRSFSRRKTPASTTFILYFN